MTRSCLAVVLAAGEGSRMKSDRSKVLLEVGGIPMVNRVVRTMQAAGSSSVAVVIGRDAGAVRASVEQEGGDLSFHEQQERLGTAHAVLTARSAIAKGYDDIVVVFGDTPLLTAETVMTLRAPLAEGAEVVVGGFFPQSPTGYGRLLTQNGELFAIREEKDASEEERKIRLVNGGIMALSGKAAIDLLESIGNDNAKKEFYLTDVVKVCRKNGGKPVAREVPTQDVQGCNTPEELAELNRLCTETVV